MYDKQSYKMYLLLKVVAKINNNQLCIYLSLLVEEILYYKDRFSFSISTNTDPLQRQL